MIWYHHSYYIKVPVNSKIIFLINECHYKILTLGEDKIAEARLDSVTAPMASKSSSQLKYLANLANVHAKQVQIETLNVGECIFHA